MHWAKIGEAGFIGGMRFLFCTYRCLGAWPFRFFLFFVILWFFLTRPLARRASREYLQRLHASSQGTTPAPTRRNSFRHFLRFGETLLEKMLSYGNSLKIPCRIEGEQPVLALLAEKRGVLLITAHLGNLELCRCLTRARPHIDIKLTVLVYTRHAQRFNQMLHALNPELAIDLVQVDRIDFTTAMLLSERVAAGGMVVIAGDRVPVSLHAANIANATIALPFLGAPAHFPAGPYVLAAALGCPVFTLFSARRDDAFLITLHPLADRVLLPRRERQEAIRPYAQRYVAALTEECQKNPLQWFNFFPFWQQDGGGKK
ncbi:MAG: acyltransferase [Zoogloeaceae bacterium]|jgi:predicted LPLAT superfamily acyltransferase|nr:acyltransferase [Zoogloeaceae bacterium]